MDALKSGHNTFPVLNRHKQLVGKIQSQFLIVLIEQQHWYRLTFDMADLPSEITEKRDFFFDGNRSMEVGSKRDSKSSNRPSANRPSGARDKTNDKYLEQDLEKHSKRRLTLSKYNTSPPSPNDINKFMNDERELMRRVSRIQRGNSEMDTHDYPQGDIVLDWRYFNTDLHGNERDWEDIKFMAFENADESLDLRPYLITCPFICFSTDKMQKCLDIFRHNSLR